METSRPKYTIIRNNTTHHSALIKCLKINTMCLEVNKSSGSYNNVVNGDVDKLHEESNETHESESDGGGHRDLLELLPVRLSAALHEAHRILAELLQGLQGGHDLVHGGNIVVFSCRSESS